MESSKVYLKEIKTVLYEIIQQENIDTILNFQLSKNEEYDIQCNDFVKFKELPSDLKTKIEDKLSALIFIEICSFSSNNFLNIRFSNIYFENCLTAKQNYEKAEKKKVLLDYGGFNIGKALHVGHIRSLNIGRSLKNCLKFVGYDVKSDIHYGDWGVQMAQIISYIEKENIKVQRLSIEDLDLIYPKASSLSNENSEFSKMVSDTLQKLNNKDQEKMDIWKKIYKISTTEIEKILVNLEYEFDLHYGESDVVDLIPQLIKKYQKQKLIITDDGALIANDKQDPPAILVKSDGTFMYLTTDIATIVSREKNNQSDVYVYVTDQRQSFHFNQLFKMVEYLSLSNADFKHVGFGTINDLEGKPLKTREGDVFKLLDLFDQIKKEVSKKNSDKKIINTLAKSVMTYSDLATKRTSDYSFDIEKFVNINGKSAIYLQYSQVRARKLLENKKITRKFTKFNDDERDLAKEIINFSFALERTMNTLEPHHLAEYGYTLCQKFNTFYKNNKVLSEDIDESISSSRISLVDSFYETILIVFNCLGIEPVETM